MEEKCPSDELKECQFVIKAGVCLCVLVCLFGFFISIISGVFLLVLAILSYYTTSFFAVRQKQVGNLCRSYVPPRTKWCSKIEFDHVLVPPDVDDSLERLYERILREHIDSWYSDLSQDEEFLQEIRSLLREVTSEVLTRLSRLDITETLLQDIIPLAIQHLDTYLWTIHHDSLSQMEPQQTGNQNIHSTWISFMGRDIHPALASRDTELQHLTNLVDRLLPVLLKNKTSKSRLASSVTTSVLASSVLQPLLDLLFQGPNINKLLLVWFSPDQIQQFQSCKEPPARLLFRFVHSHSQIKPSALHVDLSAILKDQQLLYPFLQYLKKNGGVNLLQFCLAVEDFNKKMMVVDLKDEDLGLLHKDAKRLYDTYIKIGADNFIKFDDDIISDVGNIVNQGFKHIQKLRTTPPLFRAYEQVYNNLEDNFCPQFHTSDEFLGLVLGPRLSDMKISNNNKNDSSTKSSPRSSSKSKGKLSKLKNEVLGPGIVDGTPEPESDSELQDEDTPDVGEDSEVRDLSAWRVHINSTLEARIDPLTNKSCFYFVIQVQRIDKTSQTDGCDLQGTVYRQYHEFYSLQSALVQYHGLFEDAKLPPRAKLFGGKGLDVLQSKLEPFQDYLVKLLQKPSLKKSDLLFTFLTSKQEFNEAATNLDLSRMIKGVPTKLTKEKGQFLQSFISTYVGSTLSPPPKSGSYPPSHSDVDIMKQHPIYQDNFSSVVPFKNATLGPSQTCSVHGIYDTFLYLGLRLFNLSEPWQRMVSGLRWLVADSFNHLVHYLLASKVDTLLNSGRVSHLIGVVEESIFDPPGPEMDQHQIVQQTEQTLEAFRDYLPSVLATVLGEEKFKKSTSILLDCLQEPLLNKQLAYSLLDNLLVKLFPELRF